MTHPHGRNRPWLSACATAVAVAVALPPAVTPPPPRPPSPGAAVTGPTDFSSSLEPTDPQPTWTDTAETDAAGRKKMSGVIGDQSAGIPGNIMGKVVDVRASGDNPPSETVRQVVDGDVNTKWLVFSNTGWVQARLSEPVAVVEYALTSANDAPGRDPKDWKLQGSADGQTWTDLDARSGEQFPDRFTTRRYRIVNTTAYPFYRLNITANSGDGPTQLAEWQLSNGDTTPPPASDMKAFVGGGPANSATAKPNAGFSGLKALRYAGNHIVTGRGYAYDKVFDVDVAVTRDSELSYLIFPEFTAADPAYPSTYAAVDLAFDDGTYLSDLNAVDQQAVRLNPRAQGESRTLYADQWNRKAADIGAVAAGKRIRRVLIGYDNPNGPALFGGWVDDIRIVGKPARNTSTHPSDHVITTRGTNSSGGFSRGNNIPAAAVPHGFNFWVPETNAGTTTWLYEYARANNAANLPTIQAFAASHQPSPWMGDRQTFQVMPQALPSTGLNADRRARALAFRHDNEIARPHHYAVTFDNGLRTEIAPTDHAAMFRFTFPGTDASLIFDNVNDSGGLTVDAAAGVVTGYSDVKSGLSTGATRLFVYATFDRPIAGGGKLPGGGGPDVTGYATFGGVQPGGSVTMRIATSLLGVDQARRNLEQEIAPTDTFESVRNRAQRAWDATLGIVEVQGASEDQLTTLYSNLYRLFLYPNSGYENTGDVRRPVYRYASPFSPAVGPDTPTETGAKVVEGKVYVNNGFWDTYRTTWPAYTLLTPTKAGEMIDGFVQQYRDGGWISRWSSPGYADLMTGTSSDVAFADAYVKGVRNFDASAAYEAAVKNATVAPTNAGVGRKGMDTSVFLGYTPTTTGEGMSWALEGYINDFGIATMAKAMGREDDYRYYLNRAQNYVHMFDPSIGFFQGRKPDGSFRAKAGDYDPRVWGGDYTETDGWNFAFHVPQDGAGLAALYGGRAGLASKLDTFFTTPETARYPGSYGGVIHEMREARDVRMGQYGHSNQVSHHIIYMYDYAGQPWKAQAKVRDVLARLYSGSEIGQGYPGDEDNGEMSAWQIFSALGFYPLQMGSPYYAVGSPLFTKATVHLENGRSLTINAPKNSPTNVYVQGLKVNGKRYDKAYLPHDLLARGAVLDFDLGPAPSAWGSGRDDAPPSITQGDAVPRPLADVSVTVTGSPGAGPALVDNSSASQATFDVPTPWVQCRVSEPAEVSYYTLTSGTGPGDPKSWVLKASVDGRNWMVIDSRRGETFPWRRQTRQFRVANPGKYAYYSLEVVEGSGGATSVAEMELLGR
ncbi:alpha-1 2-mannosidase [Planosporangium mesophilum]|uniref:Alpha-1 2-mannosidase n=1 Tax=Planosporangium mesophilum TaxID=689768 RepID=A0A8J3TAZ3_9ACTN|nr:GH92 family glycosyl hydrolase [Planosporangium mesophilum]NJC83184.1 glycoside hydrolase family 92 protein [Planosporangium mesophilum]GII21554.1 alpha-1 2-mannosidase [Planosporangium mesophilum]